MAKGNTRRAKVVKAMIAFVAVLALLTFFSNTIMNLTIPKVMGTYASRGNLSYSNSARGTVTVDNQAEIKGIDGRVVDEVLVTGYDVVKKGDVILTLKTEEESEELKNKKDTLKQLERERAYEARQPKPYTDFGMYQDTINQAKTTLSEAKTTLNKVKNKSAEQKKYQNTIDEESVKVVSLEASVNAAAETIENIKSQIDEIDAKIAPLQSQIDVYVALGTPTPTPTPIPGTEDPDDAGTPGPTPGPEMITLINKINQLKAEKKQLQTQLSSAQDRLDEAAGKLAECQGKIDKAQQGISDLAMLPSEQNAKNAVSAAQSALNSANKSYSDAKTEAGISADKAKDQINDRNEQIANLKKEIAELEEKAKIKDIKAPADGFIYNLAVSSGDTLTSKDVIGSVLPENDRTCVVTFSFSSSTAQEIWVGQQLEVTSGFARSCTVVSKKPDPENPRGNTLVKCVIDSDDSWPGEEITVNAGRGNSNYNCVVPSSAVNEDASGSFVYVIVGSSTPLGDKYVVKRVDVSVEATDGSASAIKGEGLDKYDIMIVIRSEKPLEDGQRVRLEDYAAK